MSADIAISVQGVGKKYQIGHQKSSDLRSSLVQGFKRKLTNTFEKQDFWALEDISFEVKRGEAVGIIGRNGAGKSTLLKILSRITEPSTGRIEINGRVSSLLEVGTGFHPELTGRENIYLNGTILGMRRAEIKAKFDEIVAFSGVEKFIDTPVKHYSSGMKVRLAFSVAAHLEPEILIVDEVLAVGDAEFQKKCLGKMNQVSKYEGRTVLFVSHNMNAVQTLCTRGILLGDGQTIFDGGISQAVVNYTQALASSNNEVNYSIENAPGNEMVRFLHASVKPTHNNQNIFQQGDEILLNFNIYINLPKTEHIGITFLVVDEMGTLLFVGGSSREQPTFTAKKGHIHAQCVIPENLMNEGNFSISRVLVVQNRGTVLLDIHDVLQFDIVPKNDVMFGWMGQKQGAIRPKLHWSLRNTTDLKDESTKQYTSNN